MKRLFLLTLVLTAIGLSSKAQTASDSYLDIANYATIDQAGWNHSLVNKLYTYDSESRWLKLSMYGAFVGAKYSTTSTTFNSGSPQKWIATSITQSNQCGNTTWNATDVFLGSSNYFTGTAKAVGTNSTSSRTDKSVTFYVTNTTDVKLYGSQATNSTTYPTTLKVYECDKSLNANSTVTTQGSLTTSGAGTISLTGLDATKIYKVVASQARGYIYEIAFQTPPPTIIAEPASVTFDNAEITYTYTKTVTVKGLNLLQGITASISGSSDFSIDNTSLNAKGGTITVTYSPQAVGSTQATLTLSNADAEDVSIPISGTAQPMKPHNLMINDVTAYTANASWESANNATSYNLRYRKVLGYNQTFSESFENGFTGWTLIDNDGDGNNWTQFNPENFNSGAFEAHDGDYGAMSRSWMSNPLTPDNWLISPQVDLGGVLKYYIIDDGGYQETYRVYVSTTGTNISDFVPLTDDLLSPGANSWTEMTISLSAYEGQRGYIAFRNYNCTDEDFMMIDAVSIDAMTYGDWVEVNNVSSPYTITGLDPETDYVAQVQAVYNTGNSDWTPSVLFTTSSANALPIDLTVNNVTDNSADASWYGSQDNYNLRYRPYVDPVNQNRTWDLNTTDQLEDWYIVDADNDGYNWGYSLYNDGDYIFYSASYINDVGAITPNNWLITPKVKLGGTLKFSAWGLDSSDYAEVFQVYVGPEEFDGISQFTAVSQNITVTHSKTEYEFDLSGYEGYGRIAIVHHNCTNMWYLAIDDISIEVPNPQPDNEWITVNNTTAPYSMTGLTDDTKYEVQVQGNLSNGTTDWTASTYFTTLLKEVDLATLVTSTVGKNYRIADGDLTVVAIDGNTFYCKDDNAYANKVQPQSGDDDYILGHTDLMEGKTQYDESNWVALTISGQQELPALVGSKLKGVKGSLTDANNPTFALLEMPTAYDTNSYDYDMNVFIVPSFGDNEQEIGDKTYFFVNPKPMEIATVTWAMWDEASECFKTPTQVGSSNQLGFEGSINVDMSQFAGNAPTLQDGNIYSFTALIRKNASSASGAPRRAPGDGYTIYALEGMQKIGSIEGDVVTGNANVKVNGDVLRVVYSNEAGQVSSTPWKGVNIVVTIYTDGKRTVTKRMF